MSLKQKHRLQDLAWIVIVGLAYVFLLSSGLVLDTIESVFGEVSFGIVLVIDLALLILTAAIMILNVYAFSVYKQAKNLIYFLLSMIYGAILVTSLIQKLDLPRTFAPMSEQSYLEFNEIMIIIFLSILLVKVYTLNDEMFLRFPVRHIPILMASFVFVFLLVYQGALNTELKQDIVRAFISLLLFFVTIGFVVKYMSVGDRISRAFLVMIVIYTLTAFLPKTSTTHEEIVFILKGILRVAALIYALNHFYQELFTNHILDVKDVSEQREQYMNALEREVEARTRALRMSRDELKEEIASARRLQESILPPSSIHVGGLHVLSQSYICENMSGDFFDIYKIDDQKVGMYILDVSGHGINAALMNIFCYQYVRSASDLLSSYHAEHPDRNLAHLYQEFNKMNFPDGMHIVIFLATYDAQEKRLTYSAGGLNTKPILVRHWGDVEYLEAEGFPICKMGSFFTPEYQKVSVNLQKGDRILFYTDGLLDQRQGMDLSEQDLIEFMLTHLTEPIASLRKKIEERIAPFERELVDDVTYMLFEVEE